MEHIFHELFPPSRGLLPLSSKPGLEPEASTLLIWLGRSYSHIREQCLVTHREDWETTFPEPLSCIK